MMAPGPVVSTRSTAPRETWIVLIPYAALPAAPATPANRVAAASQPRLQVATRTTTNP